MSLHLNDNKNDFAPIIIMPGDPNRAEWIAKTFLHDVKFVKNERKNDAYTGYTKDNIKVTVMPSGMGISSMSIYAHELFEQYGVKVIIRVGTCGVYQEEINVGDLIVPTSVSTDSNFAFQAGLNGYTYSPCADGDLLYEALKISKQNNLKCHFGNVLCSEAFYVDDENYWKKWAKNNVLGVEMETYALYALAAKFKCKAISLLCGTDHFAKQGIIKKEDRVNKLTTLVELAIEIIKNINL